ncbi:metal-dependent hydrolase [Mycolicibacter sp. MYC123]|uniref:Metal-dependent hydrolase n=1 Tax=[Mycobacterium] zoologicum TaxID=2872311 RepID=A0ABU5YIG6_9MYCO|nr:metal-dependent hydrolase [Mycolicibacter sp. MYC123]MEB3049828.1 metal-dependent hydrolase [Mycolicibacter sp. MYC123]
MTDLTVRRIRFDFEQPVPVVWHPTNPGFSHAVNLMSFIAIGFEKMIVAAVQEAKSSFTDPAVATEALAFVRQEAQHANAHRQHVGRLIKQYPGLQQTFDAIMASYDEMTRTKSLAYRLAYIANLEATFSPSFRFLLDNEDKLFRPGDDRVASLLLWHMVEEVEHRSSALTIYNAVVGKRIYRLRVVPSVVHHIMSTLLPLYIEGMNAHVPQPDRVIDARAMSIRWRMSAGKRDKHPRHLSVAGMLDGVSRQDKWVALRGLLRSQNPFFDPEAEEPPAFADQWFERYERGDDGAHWYSSQRSG